MGSSRGRLHSKVNAGKNNALYVSLQQQNLEKGIWNVIINNDDIRGDKSVRTHMNRKITHIYMSHLYVYT